MTALISRISPSPVPHAERRFLRDVSDNIWVRSPAEHELAALFGELDLQVAPPVAIRRRPSPERDHR